MNPAQQLTHDIAAYNMEMECRAREILAYFTKKLEHAKKEEEMVDLEIEIQIKKLERATTRNETECLDIEIEAKKVEHAKIQPEMDRLNVEMRRMLNECKVKMTAMETTRDDLRKRIQESVSFHMGVAPAIPSKVDIDIARDNAQVANNANPVKRGVKSPIKSKEEQRLARNAAARKKYAARRQKQLQKLFPNAYIVPRGNE